MRSNVNMNTMITGSTGFVGQNLLPYLESLSFAVNKIDRKNLISANWDLSNTDAIVHLAGKAHDLKKTANPDEYYDINFELTKKLYDAFLKSDATKFIFISSVKAASDTVDGILTEDMEANPKTHYGKSKLLAEQYIQQQPLPQGKAYYILRPCMIHGPGNKGNLNLLYKFVEKGIPYPLAAFNNKRSFLSVENLCFVIAQLLQKGVAFGIYNVADDEALSTNEVVEILANSMDKQPNLWKLNPSFVSGLAKIGDTLGFPLNTERLNKLTENYVVSNGKIKNAITLSLPITTKEGLLATANSFRNK